MHTPVPCTHLAPADRNGLAIIGTSPARMRGLRFADGEDGATPNPAGDGKPEDKAPEVDPDKGKEPAGGADKGDADKDPESDDDTFDADRAREKIRKINSEASALRKRLAAEEAKGKENAGNGEKVTALEADNLRLRIGLKHGLPESLVERLKGTTEAELLEDAEKLMSLFGSKKPPTQQPREQLRGGGDPTTQKEAFDPDKFAEDVFRR